jgi:hypothetical protein
MAVRYEGDLETLILDLENRGYRVRNAKRLEGAPGRTADIFLDNDVTVAWDSYSFAVWTEGSTPSCKRVETYLKLRYEGGILGRVLGLGLCNMRLASRYVGQKIGYPRTVTTQIPGA